MLKLVFVFDFLKELFEVKVLLVELVDGCLEVHLVGREGELQLVELGLDLLQHLLLLKQLALQLLD